MLFLVLSIFCSVIVGVIFKISRNYSVNSIQIVAINYVTALLLCFFTFSPNVQELKVNAPWSIYIGVGILLPVVFLFLIASIKYMGIVKTDAAQRLSLFIPILAAWFIFKEDFNSYKILGLLVGFTALLFILKKQSVNDSNKWIYPALVLLGFGVIDILFKQIALYTTLPYTTSLFVVFTIALVVSLIVVVYDVIAKKSKINLQNMLFGALVGIFNFGNILFYLKAHKSFSDNPSTVFAGMNMGVIILGSLVGLLFFKEKISKINFIGLFLALIAIVLIVISQFK
ncbi:DMT family transporter [Flavobacterium sp. Fl-77]|uniref:DMT family transporter n=1 Tax=Flavobacterium flavipigmentatum TaxID=2893884 RepID=A0AAJ2SIV7_9FLAO|nr:MULTISPECIES: DMT family transporter [unclassified Flavobacterium]MDX6183763.1 DMT family transporter [Flavobacterium sp. Fl-33]MDX6187276.1 DMT family transporter [Flavobacterium sp. Fl-77]UFH38091.1 DMT family transporter [Flavobacterium sp. F-70]